MKIIGIGTLNFTKKNFKLLSSNLKYIYNNKIFLDTSPNYGQYFAEKSIRKLIKTNRNKFFVASKFGLEFDKSKNSFSKKIKLTKNYILTSLNKTLKNLETNFLDLYQIHSYNLKSNHDEVIKTLIQLKNEKKIMNIGCVNFNYDQIIEYELKQKNKFFDFIQVHYNFFERRAEDNIIPYCDKYKKKIIVNRIFGSGIFVNRSKKDQTDSQKRLFLSLRLKKKYLKLKKEINYLLSELKKNSIDEKHFLVSWMKFCTKANVLLFGVSKKDDIKYISQYFRKPLSIKKIEYIDNLMQSKFKLNKLPNKFHE